MFGGSLGDSGECQLSVHRVGSRSGKETFPNHSRGSVSKYWDVTRGWDYGGLPFLTVRVLPGVPGVTVGGGVCFSAPRESASSSLSRSASCYAGPTPPSATPRDRRNSGGIWSNGVPGDPAERGMGSVVGRSDD